MSYDVLSPEQALVWPYGPDWSASFNVKRSFATDIFVSRDDTEQRRATRYDPRFAIDYVTRVAQPELRTINDFMRRSHNRPVVVPDFARWARTTAPSLAGSNTLTIAPLPAWAVAGQRVVLCGATLEEALIESVAGTTITLTDNLASAWASGSVLRPTFFGLLDAKISTQRVTRANADINVSVDALPGGEPDRDEGTPWATLDGREIFTLLPDYAQPPSLGYLWPVEQVDFGRGRTAQFRPVDTPQRTLEANFSGLDVETAAQLEQFFDSMKGRRGAFYLPTWEKDLLPLAGLTGGSDNFAVAGLDVFNEWDGFDFEANEVGVAICVTDGTIIYRRVNAIFTTVLSPGNSVFDIDGTWPGSISLGSIARVSWMRLARFASDDMTTSWKTPLTANVRLAFQTVKR